MHTTPTLDELAEEVPPAFFVIGEQKCGTSSLWNFLQKHPQIVNQSAPLKTNEATWDYCYQVAPRECREVLPLQSPTGPAGARA